MGILRLILALDVVCGHLAIAGIAAPYSAIFFNAYVAVCVFFIISGFYMSLVLTESYDRPFGTADFYVNRVLRLGPVYWVALAFGIVLFPQICVLPTNPAAQALMIVEQATLLPAMLSSALGLSAFKVPWFGQMYTVGLELLFYAIAPLIVRRPLPALLAAFGIAVFVHFLPAWLGLPARPWQYDFFPSTLMFFFAGALSYRLYAATRGRFDPRLGWLALVALVLYSLVMREPSGPFTNTPAPLGLYIVATFTIPFIFAASKNSTLDRNIGDLSYPIYVLHFPVIWACMGKTVPYGPILVPALCLALSALVVVLIERPIDRTRHRFSVAELMRRRQRSPGADLGIGASAPLATRRENIGQVTDTTS